MRIHIKITNLELTKPLAEYIKKKIGGLGRFVKKFEKEGEVEIFFEIARTTRHHKSGNIFYAEANVEIDGKILRATEKSEDIRTAVDKVRSILQREIRRLKERAIDKNRRNIKQ